MGELVTYRHPDVTPLRDAASSIERRADELDVIDTETDAEALEIVRLATTAERTVDERLGPIIDDINRAHKGMTGLRSELKAPLVAARRIATAKHADFEIAARKAAAEESARQEAAAREREETRIAREAEAANAAGDPALAELILQEPVFVPVPYVAPATAKVAGISSRETWRAEVVDLLALARFVSANPQWVNLLTPNAVALNAAARAQKGGLAIPGVRAIRDTSLAVRR